MEELLDDYYAVNNYKPNLKCNVCNCWITRNNFKRHLLSRKHARQVEWNLLCNAVAEECKSVE